MSEILLIVSGFVLTFGAIGEYLEEHGKLPSWLNWPKLVFVFMVALSLVGEFISDAGVFFSSSKLQTISDGEFAGLNKEAGDARKTAGAADERSKLLEASNKQLGINLETEKQKTARLDKLASTERIARIQLEERVAPRHITDDQRNRLREALKNIPPMPMTLVSCLGDAESGQYAFEIMEILNAAGWNIAGIDESLWKIPTPRGISVAVGPPGPGNERASPFQRAFRSVGIMMHAEMPPDFKTGQLEVRVYFKPLPIEAPTVGASKKQ